MAEFRQTSFAAGELSPTMWGRTDLPYYEHGLRRCHNFVIDQHGAAVFRPGMRFVSTLRAGSAFIFPLVTSPTSGVVLVFSPNFLRIYPSSSASFTEIPTPYGSEIVSTISVVPFGSGAIILAYDQPPRELRRTGGTWVLEEFHTAPQFANPTLLTPIFGNYHGEVPDTGAGDRAERRIYGVTLVYQNTDTGAYVETKITTVTTQGYRKEGTSYDPQRNPDGSITWPRGNPWAGTLVANSVKSGQYPSRHIYILQYPDMPIPPGHEFHSVRLYQGVVGTIPDAVRIGDGLWGLLAETTTDPRNSHVVLEFNINAEPDYSKPPRTTYGGFAHYKKVSGGTQTHYYRPLVGGLHDQRLILGAPPELPSKLWFSQVDGYDIFDLYHLPAAHHPLTVELATPVDERIVSLVSHRHLLAFTDAAVWVIKGDGDSPVSVGNAMARIEAEVGASFLRPIVFGSDVFFVNRKRDRIYRLRFDGRSNTYDLENVTAPSAHLFNEGDSRITSWGRQAEDSDVMWVVRGDGTFVSYTYSPETGVAGFAQHTTQGRQDEILDRVVGFASVPTTSGEATFAIVWRQRASETQYFLERLDRDINLDSHILTTFSPVPSDRNVTITGLTHLIGRDVQVIAWVDPERKVVLGPPSRLQGSSLSLTLPTLPGEDLKSDVHVVVGLPYVGELELLDFPVEKLRVKSISKVGWEVVGSRGLLTGEDFDHLTEWQQTTIADVYGPSPATGLAEVYIGSTWNHHGRAVLRQPLPLPLTVLGVTRAGNIGG